MTFDLVNRHLFCNCPDYAGRQGSVFITNQLSLTRDRDWSESDYGPKNPGYCKHLWSVALLRGDKPNLAINDPPVVEGEPLTFA